MIGQLLINQSIINENQLEEALKIQKKSNKLLGKILEELGYCFNEDIAQTIARNAGLPYMDIDDMNIDRKIVACIPANLAVRNNMVPVRIDGDTVTIACANVPDQRVISNLKRITRKNVDVVISCDRSIKKILLESFSKTKQVKDQLQDSAGAGESVSGILEETILKAIRSRSTDIHFEPERDGFRIRLRIDGMLSGTIKLAKELHTPMISRIKILSGLDIAERRVPQDGSFVFHDEYKEENVDIRVSILPCIHGEKCVIRLLPSNKRVVSLRELGMNDNTYARYRKLIERPHGIILITGPTGSGKTTTLAASLEMIKSKDINITTIEDPVEYKIDGINQTMVDSANKVTFAKALRSILRQDPDVIMVGEIRDKETADIALRSALTGHLVFSTLHTNDSASALTRLVDMGCEPFLVSATVSAVMAQRLVRLNCPHCSSPYSPSQEQMALLGIKNSQGLQWSKGTGCKWCNKTGTRGRAGIFELLEINPDIQQAIVRNESLDTIRNIAAQAGMTSLREDCLQKINSGLIPFDEALRVTVSY